MRNAASWAIAVAGVTLGLLAPPVWQPLLGDGAFIPMATAVTVPLLIALIATVTGTLRAGFLATRRAELASRRALGQARGALIAAAAGRGALAGAVWGLGSLLAGSVTRQLITGFGAGGPDWYALQVLAWFWVALAAGASLGWAVAARWATRPSRGDDAPVASRRRLRWSWVAVALAVLPLASLALGWPAYPYTPVETAVGIVLAIGTYLAIPALLVTWGAALGVRIVARVAGWLGRGASPAHARALAADALTRPAPLRAAAVGAIGLVVAVATGASVMVNGLAERNAIAEALVPDAVVATVPTLVIDPEVAPGAAEAGWAPALDPRIVASLEADPRLTVVRAAALSTDGTTVPGAEIDEFIPADTLLAVELAALDGVDPVGLRPTFLDAGVAIGYGPAVMRVGDVTAAVASPSQPAPFAGVELGWAEETFGPAETSAVLVYGHDVEAVLAEHDLGDAMVSERNGDNWGGTTRIDARGLLTVAGPFLLGAVAIVVVLAGATQRLRWREHATLVALGALRGTMRGAAALEAAVVTGVGAALGLVAGAVIGLGLSAAGGAGGFAIRAWNVGFDVAQAPWAALVALAVVTTGLAAGLAALVRVRADRSSPAEQLREAEKEGVA
ncbi:FtsX-like permease family protein [Demequina phytophila]|uniref:FtsX-like permease family protein n=1 Tax=Demequina phytophila TaxID=1638981 RepID=UPI00078061E3|nr:FtsX-like permease family protein [Demequina phytophila]